MLFLFKFLIICLITSLIIKFIITNQFQLGIFILGASACPALFYFCSSIFTLALIFEKSIDKDFCEKLAKNFYLSALFVILNLFFVLLFNKILTSEKEIFLVGLIFVFSTSLFALYNTLIRKKIFLFFSSCISFLLIATFFSMITEHR